MKKYLSVIVVMAISILFTSCLDNGEKPPVAETDTTKKPDMKTMIPHSSCYELVSGKDSFWLKVEKFENVTTGQLVYNFSEKDDSKGDLDGVMKGDTLIAEYTFDAEGKKSVRQVAFLVKENVATEGTGAMQEKDGKMVFSNPAALQFNGLQLKKADCVK